MSHIVAERSPNRGTKVGAVIYHPVSQATLSVGVNKLPQGMDVTREELHQAPLKGMVWEHAERNAIFLAARHGVRTEGMGIAVNWYPCAECARAIVDAGITQLVCSEPDFRNERWKASWLTAQHILHCGGVEVLYVHTTPKVKETPKTPGPPKVEETPKAPSMQNATGTPKAGRLIDWPKSLLTPQKTLLQPIVP